MTGHEGDTEDNPEDPIVDTFTVTHNWDGQRPVSGIIVRSLSAILGKPPQEFEPVFESIDTDALDRSFQPLSDDRPRNNGAISFGVEQVSVTVYANGEIVFDVPAACPWEERDREIDHS